MSTTSTPWPEGVIARYLTVGGATVDLINRSGWHGKPEPTETYAKCSGCGADHAEDWGWSGYHDEFGHGPQSNFDTDGHASIPLACDWAQAHAESCRAMPRPGGVA